MNGKPVHFINSRVLNMDSGFAPKLLCDGPTFTAGTACVYRCAFCYVPAVMMKSAHVPKGVNHFDVVVRRRNAVETLRSQLTTAKGKPKYLDPNDRRVIYASPLVDVAGNMDLVRETAEMCKVILELTNWQIRLLSKSNLLPKVATIIGDITECGARSRVIFGVSTGTLNDKLAQAFEEGCPLVSKRLESLRWLQDNGYRTFGMICPSLPFYTRGEYREFSRAAMAAIRAEKCEHVWAEPINLRGDSFRRTHACLAIAGFTREAEELERVMSESAEWEIYARATFEAHREFCPPEKLRFLQYVNEANESYWSEHCGNGAVLL